MEMTEATPQEPRLEDLTSQVVQLSLAITKDTNDRNAIIQRMESRTHTEEDIQLYIHLTKLLISNMERELRVHEEIEAHFKENDPEKIDRALWRIGLERCRLQLLAQQSHLDDFLHRNGRSQRSYDLFQQLKAAEEIESNVGSAIKPSKIRDAGEPLDFSWLKPDKE